VTKKHRRPSRWIIFVADPETRASAERIRAELQQKRPGHHVSMSEVMRVVLLNADPSKEKSQ
jgi:hypothetical protein